MSDAISLLVQQLRTVAIELTPIISTEDSRTNGTPRIVSSAPVSLTRWPQTPSSFSQTLLPKHVVDSRKVWARFSDLDVWLEDFEILNALGSDIPGRTPVDSGFPPQKERWSNLNLTDWVEQRTTRDLLSMEDGSLLKWFARRRVAGDLAGAEHRRLDSFSLPTLHALNSLVREPSHLPLPLPEHRTVPVRDLPASYKLERWRLQSLEAGQILQAAAKPSLR
ncbi:MAG: uncharacterized protein KVP18_002620 [Porospora cf. gigantea A]|uniref:uncharacterized protein n=1 Tax=Porospora cf. gigantea A TaxID=2853593 RepID=UPI00355AA012|nr:MAG: hypothetical protein KVP18_002620 [Porospora cf. gigantea A]